MSWAIPLGGLAVAALALYLNYRERVSAHRLALYARQLDAFREIAVAVAELLGRAELLIASTGVGPDRPRGPDRPSLVDSKTDADLRIAIQDTALDLSGIRVRHAIFLPEVVLTQVEQLEKLSAALLSPTWEIENEDGETVTRLYHKDPMFSFTVAQLALFSDMRTLVGTEKLSGETMRLLGVSPSRWAELRSPHVLPKSEGSDSAPS